MGRKIDYSHLSDEDRVFIAARPWLVREYENETGNAFEGDVTSSVTGYAALDENDQAELERLRSENGSLREQVQTLGDEVDALKAKYESEPTTEENQQNAGVDEVPDYNDWTYEELVSELNSRNDGLEKDDTNYIHPESRSADNIVAALQADDEKHASA